MNTIEEFQALVGKTLSIHIADDAALPLKLEAVEARPPLEGDDIPDEVNKNPFTLVFSGDHDKRIPEATHKISGEGVPESLELFVGCCSTPTDHEGDKLAYEAHVS